MKKEHKQGDEGRVFRVAHQTLCITGFNFERQSLIGYVELLVHPLNPDLRKLKINSKQCRIYRVAINDIWEAAFLYNDPTLEVCQGDVKQRNLDYFANSYYKSLTQVDSNRGNGELMVRLPPEAYPVVLDLKPFRVCIEFSLEEPKGGLKFVVPDLDGTMLDRGAHLFTYGHENCSRLWFPCVDNYSEVCTWKLEFTVDMYMTAVSCGDLIETVYTTDLRKKTYHYYVSTPTAAPNIALAVGPFEVLVDPNMHEVTHFCLPHLMPILKQATSFLHEAFEFYEEMMSSRYPYSCYKQVFVDQAYCDASPYATMTILSTNLLHGKNVIDQVPKSRLIMAHAVAQQFFGCFISMHAWCDAWLVKGISLYLSGLYKKKAFGNNQYRYDVGQDLQEVQEYEEQVGGIVLDPVMGRPPNTYFATHHPHSISQTYLRMYEKKSHLVMRMLEIAIGRELLLQAFNKLLSLAQNASVLKFNSNTWVSMLLSTSSFLKGLSTVTGKDVKTFIEHWAHTTGCARFHGSFVFNRKRNVVELELKQDMFRKGTLKYVGPLTVAIQELDGTFNHNFKIEENKTRFEITCHSKSRSRELIRNKKKKIPLCTGEEVDMDLSAMDADSPVLWLRVDPEMTTFRQVTLEQPDYMWQYMLKYERDVVAQSEAIMALEQYATVASRQALNDTIENDHCFYRVRMQATYCLAKVANTMIGSWAGPPAMMTIFRKFCGSHSCPEIVRQNNFSNFQIYYLQKTIPVAMSQLRTVHNLCPPEVLKFILDLFKYNDNTRNKYSDNYYRAALVEALAATVTPAITPVTVTGFGPSTDNLTADTRLILEDIVRYMNMEKLLPCYHLQVTVACLHAIRRLQRFGHLPPEPTIFKSYTEHGNFLHVRLAALEALVDYTKVDSSYETLNWLLDFVERDNEPFVQHRLLQLMAKNPPFTHNDKDNLMSTDTLVERLWRMMNTVFAHDPRLRCDVADFYHSLYGRNRPDCLPIPESVMVLNLKERRTKMNPSVRAEETAMEVDSNRMGFSLKRRAESPLPPLSGDYPSTSYDIRKMENPSDEDSHFSLKIKMDSQGAVGSPAVEPSSEGLGASYFMSNLAVGHTVEISATGGQALPGGQAPLGGQAPPGVSQLSHGDSVSRLSEESASEPEDIATGGHLGPTSFDPSMFHGGIASLDSPSTPGGDDPNMHKTKKKKKKNKHRHKHKIKKDKPDRDSKGLFGKSSVDMPLSSDTSNANSPMVLDTAPASPEFETI